MPAIYHLFLLRKALLENLGESVANEILPMGLVEGEGVNKEERAWRAVNVIKAMDQKLNYNEVKKIRQSMSCYLTKQQIEVMDRAKENNQSKEQQIEIINSGFSPGLIEIRNGGYNFYFNRPACICRMFAKAPNQSAPSSFCECCGGNVLRIFKYWLNQDMQVEIVKTFLIGGDNCVFKLEPLN
jgi:hypothetical protein